MIFIVFRVMFLCSFYYYYKSHKKCLITFTLHGFLWLFHAVSEILEISPTIFGPYLSVHRRLHPSVFAVVLNALGRLHDLFSASLMHHFNGALILFCAPEGLLRLVNVCQGSLQLSDQPSDLLSSKWLGNNVSPARKKKKKDGCYAAVIAEIV